MKRDIICLIRLFIDSLPKSLRNSKLLFRIAQIIFRIPSSLFQFREEYESNKYKNLSKFYLSNSKYSLKRISKKSDINSFHIRLIKKVFKLKSPLSLLDVGCGTGYLIDQLNLIYPLKKTLGIDFQVKRNNNENIKFKEGDILKSLRKLPNSSFEFVTCTHVLEHLPYPKETLLELRRICNKTLIIICPIEKKFKWCLNYHINFYINKETFLNFCLGKDYKKNNKLTNFSYYYRLGDMMYVEFLN